MDLKDSLTPRNQFIIVMVFTIFLRLINITSEQLWEDEVISIAIASSSDNDFWRFVIGDIHPPLYYVILRGWILMFGTSVFSTRLLSAIFSILTLPILYLIGKEIKDEKLGLIVIFLYSISPFSIFFANEVRAYALIHLLFTIILYFGINCLKTPHNLRNYLYLSIFGILLIYTHYMGFIYYGVVLIGITHFNRKEKTIKKNMFFIAIITSVSYIPWIPYAFQDSLGGAHGYAGGQLNLINIAYWAFNLFIGPVPSKIEYPYVRTLIILTLLINIPLMILAIVSLIGVFFTYKKINHFDFKETFFFIIILTALFFGSSIIIGFIVADSLTAKNLIGGLSLIYILEAFGLYQLFFNKSFNILESNKRLLRYFSSKSLKRLIHFLLISLLILNMVIYPIFRASYLQKPDWDGCFKKLKKEHKKNDIIVMGFPGGPYSDVMEYYSDLNDFDLEDNFYELYYNDDALEEFFEDMLEENITRIWIITFWDNYRDPKDDTIELLVDEFNLEEIDEYKYRLDIRLTLYEI